MSRDLKLLRRKMLGGAMVGLFGLLAVNTALAQSVDATRLGLLCDPYRPQVDQAQALIRGGRTADATSVLNGIVTADRNNIVANFLLGTLLVAQPGTDNQQNGLNRIQLAANAIPTRPTACAKLLHWYSIYVTLGGQFYNRGDRVSAKKYLLLAYVHRNDLKTNSRLVLLDDLGRLSLSEGDFNGSVAYFKEAQQYGSTTAAKSIAQVTRVQDALRR